MSTVVPAKNPTILVVDDNADNLDLVRDVFEEEPYEICTATSAVDAMERLERDRPDLAILDVQMPRVDGYELCRMMRETFGPLELPIIFLTAERTGAGDAVRGLDLGACDYMSKPFSPEELRARVRTALRGRDEHARGIREARTLTRRIMQK